MVLYLSDDSDACQTLSEMLTEARCSAPNQIPAISSRQLLHKVYRSDRSHQYNYKVDQIGDDRKVNRANQHLICLSRYADQNIMHKEHAEAVVPQDLQQWHLAVAQLIK